MPQIISHSERQKIESSPTQATEPHSLLPCVSVAFKSSQAPPVPSLTPPPPRHYLRNANSSEKLHDLIQKRSDIYTRVRQAQQDGFDSSWEAKVRPQLLTRSSSTVVASVNPWTTHITRSASYREADINPGRSSHSAPTKSPTEVCVVEIENLSTQRRETMVLGFSEIEAHSTRVVDTSVAPHPYMRQAVSDPNHVGPEHNDPLGSTTTPERNPTQ
jgi:hypothetical protein